MQEDHGASKRDYPMTKLNSCMNLQNQQNVLGGVKYQKFSLQNVNIRDEMLQSREHHLSSLN